MTLDLGAITERYAAKESTRERLTSADGPALGKLQIYAVTAAVSADDVPTLIARLKVLEAQRARLLWMTDLPMGSKPSVDLIHFADAIRQTINSPGCRYCPPTPGCTSCSLDGDCECYDHQHLS